MVIHYRSRGLEKRRGTLFFSGELVGISYDFPSRGALDHLDVHGTIDAANAPEFRALLLDAIEHCSHHLVVGITGADFADASGLDVLVGALKQARTDNKRVDLICTDQRNLKTLALAPVGQTFGIYDSPEAALQANIELRSTSTIAPAKAKTTS